MGEKRTVRSNMEANWKWACESEENFRSFTDEVRASARRAGWAEGLREANEKHALLLSAAKELLSEYASREPETPVANLYREMTKLREAVALLARAEEVERHD